MKYKYYEAIIDAHINYLLYLNTYFHLSDIGFLELAPIINEIRYEVHENIKNVDNLDVRNVTVEVENEITESLKKRGLISVINYVDAFIDEDDLYNIGFALFLRRVAITMNSSTGNDIVDSFINKFHTLIPKSNLSIDTMANDTVEFFLSDLRIEYDKNQDIKVYILESLSYLNIICSYLNIDFKFIGDNVSIDDILSGLTTLSIKLDSYKTKLVLEKKD